MPWKKISTLVVIIFVSSFIAFEASAKLEVGKLYKIDNDDTLYLIEEEDGKIFRRPVLYGNGQDLVNEKYWDAVLATHNLTKTEAIDASESELELLTSDIELTMDLNENFLLFYESSKKYYLPLGDSRLYEVEVQGYFSREKIAISDENLNSYRIVAASELDKPDLSVVNIEFRHDAMNTVYAVGNLVVTIKNYGEAIYDAAIFDDYEKNFTEVGFIPSDPATYDKLKSLNRKLPSSLEPLKTGDSIEFYWEGSFSLTGFRYLTFELNPEAEADELSYSNNFLKRRIFFNPPVGQEWDYTWETLDSDNDQIMDKVSASPSQDIKERMRSEYRDIFKYISPDQPLEYNLIGFLLNGVDENSTYIEERERAAVIYSFKEAFGRWPENNDDLVDIVRITNGRWPNQRSEGAEKRAKVHFEKIYKRIVDLTNKNDEAAITVMAYGLRQKASNRNIESEKKGIITFKSIYGKLPSVTEEWNIMQAITYSGATRQADRDGDLLPDVREATFGTSPDNPDSDGDGFKDGAEISAGYNPKGSGKL
jgi:hypothetical protein